MNLPQGIDPELWAAFVEMRHQMKRVPFTPYAQKLILAKLEQFHASGYDANESLRESISRGWRGVFPAGERKQMPVQRQEDPKVLAFVQRRNEYYRRKERKEYLLDEQGRKYLISPTSGERVYQP